MAKTWVTGELITAEELNRVETAIENKLETETDPVWESERTGLFDRLGSVENTLPNKVDRTELSNYSLKTEVDGLAGWEASWRGTPTNSITIAGTEVDITDFLGGLPAFTFNNPPIVHLSPRFRAIANGKRYAFSINLRLSGQLSGSDNSLTVFRVNLKRTTDNTTVAYKTFVKVPTTSNTFVNEDWVEFRTRVYGDSDPFVTNGFKLTLVRVEGTQTMTLSGNQSLFFNK